MPREQTCQDGPWTMDFGVPWRVPPSLLRGNLAGWQRFDISCHGAVRRPAGVFVGSATGETNVPIR